MSEVIVVGGGAAGMMAGIAAAGNGHRVTLYEKNEKLGKKIYITGKGRCNITNACAAEDFFPNVVSNAKFLYSAFYGFTNQDMMDFLEGAGLALKVERGNRVFPVSDKASDVIRALSRELDRRNVNVHLHSKVSGLLYEETEGEKRCVGVRLAEGKVHKADAVIVATGGLSYASTGSDGDGLAFAEEAGLKVTELSPALVPFVTEEPWVPQLQGLALRNVQVTFLDGKKKLYQEFGEMLFTHFGVSGPAVLSGSSKVAKLLSKRPVVLEIDLKPALTPEQLDARLLREFEANKNRQFKNSLGALFPSKLIPVILELSGIEPEREVNAISREERQRLGELTKHFRVTLIGLRGYAEAIVTQGGVSVKEIDPGTMRVKKIPGLHFAGEVLDLDAYTGGYNLQIAWSTGYAAGCGISEE